MADVWSDPITDVDVSDAKEPQMLPAGVTLRFVIKSATYNDELKVINFKCAPLELPDELDASAPVSWVDWAVWLPNAAKQTPENLNFSKLRLKQIKKEFGIGEDENLVPSQFIERCISGVTKEKKQKAEQLAKWGPSMEIDFVGVVD